MKKSINLTKTEYNVLETFSKIFKKKGCPTNRELSKILKISDEGTRSLMWKLVAKKLVKVNKKLQSKKFYI